MQPTYILVSVCSVRLRCAAAHNRLICSHVHKENPQRSLTPGAASAPADGPQPLPGRRAPFRNEGCFRHILRRHVARNAGVNACSNHHGSPLGRRGANETQMPRGRLVVLARGRRENGARNVMENKIIRHPSKDTRRGLTAHAAAGHPSLAEKPLECNMTKHTNERRTQRLLLGSVFGGRLAPDTAPTQHVAAALAQMTNRWFASSSVERLRRDKQKYNREGARTEKQQRNGSECEEDGSAG